MSTGSGSAGRVLRLNLGGEGEEPDCINQQPEWRDLNDLASRSGSPLRAILIGGHPFLFCSNLRLPFPDDSVHEVITNGVPIDRTTLWGAGVQSTEVTRVLCSGGTWIDNGVVVHTEP
jgi:hypothetical protein